VVEQRLAELSEAAAAEGRNLMPVIVDAVRDGVTLGEVCDAWRRVWGTWREQPVF
jgi:methylmalonyl-CoA mutase N-terminal domain/subunit